MSLLKSMDSLPKTLEVRKLPTLVSIAFLVLAWLLNEIVLAWVHDHYPAGAPPLPDTFFRLFPEVSWVMHVAEYAMLCMTVSGFAVIFLHQHRWIVARRVLFCVALCYVFRACCILLFQVPVPSKNTYCAPQKPSTLSTMASRVQEMFWAAGIEQLRTRIFCGDLIVSGHTITIFSSMMCFRQYAPRRFTILGYIYYVLAFVAIICILLARKHYSIDVLAAYLFTTRTFWTYHSLLISYHAGNMRGNPMSQTWWAFLVEYLERDAPPPHLFTNVLEWPSSCPQKIRRKLAL